MSESASIILFLLAGAALLYMFTRSPAKDASGANIARGMADELENDPRRERKEHHEALSSALSACHDTHPDAVAALCWLAASDGTVSKQELRAIFRFCDEQGTPIGAGAYKAIDSLNAGMSMQVKTSEAEALRSVAALAARSNAYRLAFFGTANKMCGSQKKLSPAKQRFLKSAGALIDQTPAGNA